MSIEAMKLALEALETATHQWEKEKAITSLRQAIADFDKQEPIGCTDDEGNAYQYGYTGPKFAPNIQLYANPQPKREPLTDEQIRKLKTTYQLNAERLGRPIDDTRLTKFARAIEAAHGIKE